LKKGKAMSRGNDDSDEKGGGRGKRAAADGGPLGGLLKKAVSLGAGAYYTAEDTVSKTLNTVQIPKELLRETIESFFESYTIQINAEVKLTPKRKKTNEEPEKP
jgi:hypothetical protein